MLNLKSGFKLEGSYIIKKWDKKTGKLLWTSPRIKNKITTGSGLGVDILTRQLCGDTTYSIEVDEARIGTGVLTPGNDLTTPVLTGIIVADTDFSTPGTAIISFFIDSDDLANGTYKEFAIYCNGRRFASSVITPNFVKGSNQNATVEYSLTLTPI